MINTPETSAVPLAGTAEEPTALLHQMVRIDSVNPALVPGAAGEAGLAEFASTWFQQRGFEVTRLEEAENRPSVVAIARGSGGGKTLMFNGHLDTVTLAGYDGDPLEPRIENGCMFGRGTFDMKAGIAAMMIAAAEAAALPHRGDIIVALVADEEYASAGTEEVLRHFSADAAIVSEPTHEDIVFTHGGFVWCDVTIHGTAAHGSRSDLGVDAIAKAGRFLTGLQDLSLRLKNSTGHPSIGPGSVHASLVGGGEEYSSYPATCKISIERRTVPGESGETLTEELLAILEPIAQEDPGFSYTLNTVLERKPLEVPKNSPIVEIVSAAAQAVTGKAPVLRGEPFWTDASLMLEKGIPGILFGVDGGGAHGATEWVDLGSLDRVTRILSAAAADFCR